MHSWAIANNGVMTRDSKAAFGAVRKELVELQAGADAPRQLSRSDARKREEEQSFALLTALLVSAWADADARGQGVLSHAVDRKSVVKGKRWSGGVDFGGGVINGKTEMTGGVARVWCLDFGCCIFFFQAEDGIRAAH